MNLDKFLKKVNGWRVMGQPIGKALAYSAAFGIANGLAGIVNRFFKTMDPRIPMLIAAIVLKTNVVQKRIGKNAAELFATAAWIAIAANTVDLASIAQAPFTLLGSQPVQPPLGTRVATGIGTGIIMGIPGIGPLLAQYMGLLPQQKTESDQEGLGADYGFDVDAVGLGQAPLLLTSAEEKIASINV